MGLNDLPIEILLQILEYVPKFDEVVMVNKTFYDAVVKLSNKNLCLIVEPELFVKENVALYNSIVSAGSREVSRVVIVWTSEKTLNVIWPVIEKFSTSVKILSLHSLIPRHTLQEMEDILALVPNVEHLTMGRFRTHGARMREIDEDLNLKKLKKLCLSDCSKNVLRLFTRLPEGVLLELECVSCHFIQLKKLLKRQINIKKLKLREKKISLNRVRSEIQIELKILDHLDLESLDWGTSEQNVNIASILAKQPKLKSLALHDIVDDKVMKSVANLTHLESLTIDVKSIPANSTRYITKLLNLKHLALEYLHNSDMALFDAITTLNNQRITSMDIALFTNISKEQIGALSKSAPKLKYLRCKYERKTFGAVMRYFNFVEALHFDRYVPHDKAIKRHDQYFEDNDLCVNLKLHELRISFPLHTQLLEKLAKDCPNVARLGIHSRLPIGSLEFGLILNGFLNLKSLAVREGVSQLNQSNFDSWKSALRKLNFLWLIDSNPTSKEMFTEIFDVVTVKGAYTPSLIMAVNNKTLIHETDQHNKM